MFLNSISTEFSTSKFHWSKIFPQAFLSIAEMKGLRSLSLCDCSAITNNGLQLLSALTVGSLVPYVL